MEITRFTACGLYVVCGVPLDEWYAYTYGVDAADAQGATSFVALEVTSEVSDPTSSQGARMADAAAIMAIHPGDVSAYADLSQAVPPDAEYFASQEAERSSELFDFTVCGCDETFACQSYCVQAVGPWSAYMAVANHVASTGHTWYHAAVHNGSVESEELRFADPSSMTAQMMRHYANEVWGVRM